MAEALKAYLSEPINNIIPCTLTRSSSEEDVFKFISNEYKRFEVSDIRSFV